MLKKYEERLAENEKTAIAEFEERMKIEQQSFDFSQFLLPTPEQSSRIEYKPRESEQDIQLQTYQMKKRDSQAGSNTGKKS